MKRLLTALTLLAAGAVLFALTAAILIPSDMVMGFVKERLKAETGLVLTEKSSERILPFSIRADGLTLSNPGSGAVGELLYIDTLTVGFAPMGLLTGGLMLRIDAAVYGGSIRGSILAKVNRTEIDLNIDGVELNAIPAIVNAGLKLDGSFGGRASATLKPGGCPKARIYLKGLKLDGSGLSFKGFSLPFGELKDAGLKAKVLDCRAVIEALWIDGLDMSARLSGLINIAEPLSRSALDLDIEIVPRGGEDPMLSLLLKQYRRSANHYSIKVTGTLASPTIKP